MARRPPKKPGTASAKAVHKRRARAYITRPKLIELSRELAVRRRATEADVLNTAYNKFATLQELARELVEACSAHCGRQMGFTPINLGEDVRWGPNGLVGLFVVLAGHFETRELGLYGVLRALKDNDAGTGSRLKSKVWGLLDTALGPASFRRMVLFNIVPFAAPFDVGKRILSDLPLPVRRELNNLQVAALSTLGTPAKFAGFGGAVSPSGVGELVPGNRRLSFLPGSAAQGGRGSGGVERHSWPAPPAVR
tara:strand:- start:494 stop:1249 length:756 start_codon:yes stop_codon:yes gene_type:complete